MFFGDLIYLSLFGYAISLSADAPAFIAPNAKRRPSISASDCGAGFITLGVRKVKIVPLSQKHAQHNKWVCIAMRKAFVLPAFLSHSTCCCGKLPKKKAPRKGKCQKVATVFGGRQDPNVLACSLLFGRPAFAYIISHVILVSHAIQTHIRLHRTTETWRRIIYLCRCPHADIILIFLLRAGRQKG